VAQKKAKQKKEEKEMENTYEIAQDLVDEIIDRRVKQLEAGNDRKMPSRFWASQIGDCDRQMVYGLARWKDKPLYDYGTLALFDSGRKEEANINRLLMDLGFDISQQQNPIEIKNRAGEVICSGRIDGLINWHGQKLPYEIKSMNDYVFNSIKDVSDFQKKAYLRKYTRQMQMYLYGNSKEAGLFVLSNFRQIKIFAAALELETCEQILQRLERNWAHYKAGTLPEPIEYNDEICGNCPFRHICLVENKNKDAVMLENKVLEAKIGRLFELKPIAKEYADLDDELKAPFKINKVPEVYIGDKYVVKTKTSVNKSVDTKALPPEIKEQYQRITERTTVSFASLE
jgi:hypothetical protein